MGRTLTSCAFVLALCSVTLGMQHIYVDPSVSGGSRNGNGWANAYDNLADAEAENLDLVTAAESCTIWGRDSATTTDTTKVSFGGWTTSAKYQRYVRQDPNEDPNGIWTSGHYTIGGDAYDMQVDIWNDYVTIDGLQIAGSGSTYWGVRFGTNDNIIVKNCLFKDHTRTAYGAVHFHTGSANSNRRLQNCLCLRLLYWHPSENRRRLLR